MRRVAVISGLCATLLALTSSEARNDQCHLEDLTRQYRIEQAIAGELLDGTNHERLAAQLEKSFAKRSLAEACEAQVVATEMRRLIR